ncbi:hypothetical protein TDB9533_01723 [Thalassocella blandensis]|nr:hypothetical protein TDB9533_01723 [Thalassocella blandensis]
MMIRNIYLAAFILVSLTACMQNGINLVIQFDDVDGLSSKSLLVLDNDAIGRVNKIDYLDNGTFDVHVHIEAPYQAVATNTATFYVDHLASFDPRQVIVVTPGKQAGQLLSSGDRVKGSTRFEVYASQLRQNVDDTIRSVKKVFEQTVGDIAQSGAGIEQQITMLEQEVDELMDEVDDFNAHTKRVIKESVIPEIKQQMQKLRARMEEMELDELMKGNEQVDGHELLKNIDAKLAQIAEQLE